MNGVFKEYFDGRVGDELERADDEDEQAHYVPVTSEGLGERELDLRLDFVAVDSVVVDEVEEDVEQGDGSEHDEEQEDGVAVEEVVGFGGGVIEPDCLCRR
ncbi:hypothetical protein Vadar_023400 [Vaccinium darrowii]|uniref:Uncharacterized protein n=1 Tax=Vaccinium darrowii TaxID=229202 RepID=A0ACB7YZM5_9ERIC|nr:hypothetical protein Vadar_023400 [Vaccinium darrowii]